MRNLILSLIFICSGFSLIGENSNSLVNNSPENIVENFKKFLISNKNKPVDEREYLIYHSNDYVTSPGYSMTNSTWLKEDPVGITPLAESICTLLGDYNERDFSAPDYDYEGKLQHYIVVVDLPYYNKVDKLEYEQQLGQNNVTFNGVSTKVSFKDQVSTQLQSFISGFKVDDIFAPDAKIYITLAYVRRAIVDNKVSSISEIRLVRKKNDPFNVEFNKFKTSYYDLVDSLQIKGLSQVYHSVEHFIEYFWDERIPDVDCIELVDFLSSTDGANFLTTRCPLAGDDEYKRDMLFRCSMFIDYIFALQNLYPNSSLSPHLDIQVKWVPWLDQFVTAYFDYYDTNGYIDYGLWLRDNYESIDPLLDNVLEGVYYEYYFDLEQISYDEGVDALISALDYFGPCDNEYAPGKIFLNEMHYSFFNVIFKSLTTENSVYTDSEKQMMYNTLTSYPGVESILWDKMFNPSTWDALPWIGPKATEIAENVAKFVMDVSLINNGGELPDYTYDNTVPIQFDQSLLAPRYFSYGNSSYGTQEIYGQHLFIEFDPDEKNFDLSVYVSSTTLNCSVTQNELEDGTTFETYDCSVPDPPNTDTYASIHKSTNFFDPVYTVTIKHPGYMAGCQESNGEPCFNFVSYEPLFYTATRLKQEKFDESVNQVALALTILALPITLEGFLVSQGFWRIVHGIWLANDIAAIGIMTNPSGFQSSCNYIFGPNLGPTMATYLMTANAVIGFSQLALPIAATSKLRTLSFLEQQSTVGSYRFVKEFRAQTGLDFPGIDNQAFLKAGKAMEADLIARYGSQAETFVRIKHAEFYGLNKSVDFVLAPENAGLRSLINKSMAKVPQSGNVPPQSLSVSGIINDIMGGNPAKWENLSSVMTKEMSDYLSNFTNVTTFQRKLNAWSDLFENNKIFAMADVQAVRGFDNLSTNNKNLFLLMSDNTASGTLTTFLKDCDTYNPMLIAVNSDNLLPKSYLGYKPSVQQVTTFEDATKMADRVDEISASVGGDAGARIKHWYDRSVTIEQGLNKMRIAKIYEADNSARIAAGDANINLWVSGNDTYTQFSQQYLRRSANDPYIIIDDLMIKDNQSGNIIRGVLHDSKYSDAAPWTNNQKSELIHIFDEVNPPLPPPAFIEFHPPPGTSGYLQGKTIRVYKADVYKTIKSGSNDITAKIF